ncbi:C-type lectin domain family 12 member B-like isoform X1 [Thunnus albacares]|uniref:C-type lectin domain family 12 member B-like isoform X1 n=1 Tax=Thunnus albacares TaxID=8236 RepID=UPI001CF6D7B9|nr:C-type lectin domain family 12 member B-like isoform X1 [Thunnus albacares]
MGNYAFIQTQTSTPERQLVTRSIVHFVGQHTTISNSSFNMATEMRMEMRHHVNTPADEGRQSLEKTENCFSGAKVYKVIGVGFVLLCIIQFVLNVSLHHRGIGSCNESDFDHINFTNVSQMSPRDIMDLLQKKNQMVEENSYLNRAMEILNNQLDQQENQIIKLQSERVRLITRLSETEQKIKSCPVGWRRYMSNCYLLSSEKKGWRYANRDCVNKGAHLVILNDEVEEDIIQMFSSFTMWIGLRRGPQKTWTWVDGSSLTYRNKKNGLQSDGELLNCVYAQQFPEMNWVPASCEEQHNWVCERDLK